MTKTKFFLIGLTALTFTALASCSKDDGDTTKPVIVLNEPENEEFFQIGTTLRLDMDLSDNEALGEYKIEIHPAAGHTHSRAWMDDSHYEYVGNEISGLKSKHVLRDIDIPANVVPGEYHLMVYCFDKEGNEQHAFVTIDLDTEEHDH
jgi:hypothetical protein